MKNSKNEVLTDENDALSFDNSEKEQFGKTNSKILFNQDVNKLVKITDKKGNQNLNLNYRTLLKQNYILYRKNKSERINNLANDIFNIYFKNFEAFYAYSCFNEEYLKDVSINLKFKTGIVFNKYITNIHQDIQEYIKSNNTKGAKFQFVDIYEVNNLEKDYFNKIPTKNYFLNIFFDNYEDLKNEYESLTDTIMNFVKHKEEEENNENIDYIQENFEKFFKEKKEFMEKFLKMNTSTEFENLEKLILIKSLSIFMENLEKEIKLNFFHLLFDLEQEMKKIIEKNTIKKIDNDSQNSFNEQLFQRNEEFEKENKEKIEIFQYFLNIFIFEKNFIIYISNIISYFYGIRSCIVIDKNDNITLDFYTKDEQFKNLANDYNYPLLLKSMITSEFINYTQKNKENVNLQDNSSKNKKYCTKYWDEEKNEFIYVESIKEKNLIPFFKIDQNDITLHPPHIEFNIENEKYYRNYNQSDDFVIERDANEIELEFNKNQFEDISNLTDNNITNNALTENSNISPDKKKMSVRKSFIKSNNYLMKNRFSTIFENFVEEEQNSSSEDKNENLVIIEEESYIFRNIDKIRLLKISINIVFDMDALEDYKEYITYQVVRNEKFYKAKLKTRNILSCYLDIFNDEKNTKMCEIMRNFYGEKVAYYFYFATHYITWLFYPSILGIIFILLEFIFSILHIFQMKNFSKKEEIETKSISLRVYYVYIYLFLIVFWAVANIKSWGNKQKYFNYCWGMDGNLIDAKNNTDNYEKAVVSMGIKIPVKSKLRTFKKRIITILISVILIIFTIFMNFVLFELSKVQIFNQDKSDKQVQDLLKTGIKIIVRHDDMNGNKNLTMMDKKHRNRLKNLKRENSQSTQVYDKDLFDGLKQQLSMNDYDKPNDKNDKNDNQYDQKKNNENDKDSHNPNKLIPSNNNSYNSASNNKDQIEIIDLEHIQIKSKLMFYIIPILSVILRNVMSKINYSTALWMVQYEKHTEENEREDSFLIKMICYEFVNYYFYLYYIIFYKQYSNLCEKNNCYGELGSNLTTILITSTLLNFIELLSPHFRVLVRKIFSKKKENQDLEKIKKKFYENPRDKFYDREEYYDIMTYEYMELIMNFGYIILFGISSPICFFIAFIYAIVERFTDALKMVRSHNVNIIDKSTGVGIIVKILKFYIFLGIFTNCFIVIFLMDFSFYGTLIKLENLIIMENILVIIYLIISFNTLPEWFKYMEKIKFNYVVAILNSHKMLNIDENTQILNKDQNNLI